MKSEASVIAISYLILAAYISCICRISKQKKLANHDEFQIGMIGCGAFMHLSWVIVYIANINPFIKPEFKER